MTQADMNCWALRHETLADGVSAHYVGGNFGSSHRDQRYSACHSSADGSPQSLNVWCAFNPSGATRCNGAMRVIPIDSDDFFYSPSHDLHMDTATALSSDGGLALTSQVVLESARGQPCMWTPSLVHWGAPCCRDCPNEPRCSIAATFRSRHAPASVFGTYEAIGAAAASGGPPPLLRSQLDNISLTRRLAYVAKGLLAYSHWHPGFPGINLVP
jgi:hypothetical protein